MTGNGFNRAINGLKSTKAAELNGLTPEALKYTDKDCRKYVFDFIHEFWHRRSDLKSWHKRQCVPVPKSGDFSYLNKWQGVMLMTVMSKIFSCVINVHCFEILDAHEKQNLVGRTILVEAMASLLSRLS